MATKVAFYDTKPYDKTWFKPLAEKMNLDITFFEAKTQQGYGNPCNRKRCGLYIC